MEKCFNRTQMNMKSGGGGVIVPTATQAMSTGTGTPSSIATNKIPGFEFVLTISTLSAAYLLGRKSR